MKTAKVVFATYSFNTQSDMYHLETLTVVDASSHVKTLINTENNSSMYNFIHFQDMYETVVQLCKANNFKLNCLKDKRDDPSGRSASEMSFYNVLWTSLNALDNHEPRIAYVTCKKVEY